MNYEPLMSEFNPLAREPFAHFVNSSFAEVPVEALEVTLREAATGLTVLGGTAALVLLIERIAGGGGTTEAGPVGTRTLPPAPTVDQADPIGD